MQPSRRVGAALLPLLLLLLLLLLLGGLSARQYCSIVCSSGAVGAAGKASGSSLAGRPRCCSAVQPLTGAAAPAPSRPPAPLQANRHADAMVIASVVGGELCRRR